MNLGTTCEFPLWKWGEMEQNSTPNAFNSGSVREMKHFSDSIVCRWRKWVIKTRRDSGNFSAIDKGRDRDRE